MDILALAPADLVWSAAFHTYGTWAFLIVVGVLLVETPLVKWGLRTPWDDTVGAVFLGHLASLPVALLVGWWFTERLRDFRIGTLDGWGDVGALLPRFVGALFGASGEVLSWPIASTLTLGAAAGFSVLTFLVTARAILHVPWTPRSVGALLGVALLGAIAVGGSILLRAHGGEEASTEGA